MELQQKMKADPTFKERFVSAVKAGGTELIKVLTNNPFVSGTLEGRPSRSGNPSHKLLLRAGYIRRNAQAGFTPISP